MNEKDFNLSILAELRRIAKEVFAKVTISKEGTYTSAELWNGKNSMGEKIHISYSDAGKSIYTAQIGTFKFQVSAEDVFLRLWKFEKLCNVKQSDKARFTFGDPEGENISEKAMYLDKSDKAVTRKKGLIKLSGRVAIEADKKAKKYNFYYFAAGLWYLLATGRDESQYKAIKEKIDKNECFLLKLLAKWNFTNENKFNPIYKALFEVLQAEAVNNTAGDEKSGNGAENEPDGACQEQTAESGNTGHAETGECTGVNTIDRTPGQKAQEKSRISVPKYGNSADLHRANCRPKVRTFPPCRIRANIRRYKLRFSVGNTSYHSAGKNRLERKRNGNPDDYRVLIRGSTKDICKWWQKE